MRLADTQAIAILTGRKPATIRSWAHRGLIERHGTSHRRALYDCDTARAIADILDNTRRTPQHFDHSRTTAPESS